MSEQATRFSARVVEKIDNGPGYSSSNRVGIFDGATQVGEYVRNYPSYAEATFCPFEQDGRWYALYSRHYTATRLMSLPNCADLGGEEPAGFGFCPTGYLVPLLCVQDFKPGEVDPHPYNPRHDVKRWAKATVHDGYTSYEWPDGDPIYEEACRTADREIDAWMDRHPFVTRYARWGFVCGCVWGDDCSWKIQFLDLSRVSEGIIVRDDRFGYIELPRNVELKDAIDVERIDADHVPLDRIEVEVALPVRFRLSGERVKGDE